MRVLIENKEAVVKKGTKIDFIFENRRFTGADAYTLSITFPLKDCKQNREIFGHIDRLDVEKQNVQFNAEIFAGKLHRTGIITPTEVSEASVKCQFLEGRSEHNSRIDLSEIYVNDMYLGRPERLHWTEGESSLWAVTREFMKGVEQVDYVYLPWVNEYSGNLQNSNIKKVFHGGSPGIEPYFSYEVSTGDLSAQPYLLPIAEHVCRNIDFDFDFSEWRNHGKWKHLLVCNTLPASWEMPEFKYAMPRWTVSEFFEELEKLMDCVIDVDYRARKVTLTFAKDYYEKYEEVEIKNVITEYTATVTQENETEYEDAVNIGYAECDHEFQKYYSCQEFMDRYKIGEDYIYEDMSDMINHEYRKTYPNWPRCKGVMYVKDVDRYFIWKKTVVGIHVNDDDESYSYELQMLNQFGPKMQDKETYDVKKTINIVPVAIGIMNMREAGMYLNPGELENEVSEDDEGKFEAQLEIERGEEEKSAVYDKMYVAFWDGSDWLSKNYRLCPYIDNLMVVGADGRYNQMTRFSLNLRERNSINRIYAKTKYSISFISDELPDPRSVFVIKGRKFVCSKLTASITEEGMSEKIKGEFYLIKSSDEE